MQQLTETQAPLQAVPQACTRLERPPISLARTSPIYPWPFRGEQEHNRAATAESASPIIHPIPPSLPRHIMRVLISYETQADASEKELIKETESLLEKWKHPDPYRPPTAPGGALFHHGYISVPAADTVTLTESTGSKYERNLPCPILDREFNQ